MKKAIILFAAAAASMLYASEPFSITMDLATDKDVTLPMPSGLYGGQEVNVTVINMAPKYAGTYQFASYIRTPETPTLKFSGETKKKNRQHSEKRDINCTEKAEDVRRSLWAADENNISAVLEQAKLNIPCQAEIGEIITFYEAKTRKVYVTTVEPNKNLVLEVTRGDKKWMKTLEAPNRGRWLVHYALAFIDNKDETYYLRTQGTDSVVTEGHQTEQVKLAPSILFSYRHESLCRNDYDICLTPTAGFGVDTENISALGGASVLFGENIALTFGASYYKAQILRSEFTPGEVIPAGEKPNELYTTGYTLSWFVALGFRFDSNPFGK